MNTKRHYGLLAGMCAIALTSAPALAQTAEQQHTSVEEPAATAEMEARYERAAMLARGGSPVSLNNQVIPTWIGGEDRFWYCKQTEAGCTYTLVDARTGNSRLLFDHSDLAAKLTKKSGNIFPPDDLGITDLYVDGDGTITFSAFQKRYSYDSNGVLKELGDALLSAPVVSPDGKLEAYVKDWNIWVRDLESGEEKPITTDGQERYAYATKPGASRGFTWGSELRWAPDSKRVFTVQTDDRQVKDVPFIQYAPEDGVRPVAFSMPYAFPGDLHIPMYRMLVVDVEDGKQVPIKYRDLPAGRMLDAPFNGGRAWWGGDGKRVFFVDVERGEKAAHLISADASTGDTTELFSETNPDGYVELSDNVYEAASIVPLPERNQVIWYSERTGRPQLYLYDLATGQLVRKLTDDAYGVRRIVSADESRGEVLISISGRDPTKNPYYEEILRIDLDTGNGEILSQGDDHRFIAPDGRNGVSFALLLGGAPRGSGVSPSGDYWVETRQRIDRPAVSVIRTRSRREGATLETASLNHVPEGFRRPEPVLVKAANGKTILQGAIFRPSDFDPSKIYPVIDLIYGGPQAAVVPVALDGLANMAMPLAELGFVTVIIDGRGTTGRDREFHEHSYGAVEKASEVEDHIAAIRQLAQRYPYMDLDRVGITGFSGGGYMSTSAILRYPDFYKVAVSGAGNHDQRDFWHSWGERYQGELDGDNYLAQANLTYAKNLEGKLLLYQGLMDTGVQPGTLFNLVQKLEDENKDFDLVIAPRAGHSYTGYAQRRGWDYFVEHLAGKTPPKEFELINGYDYTIAEMKRRKGGASKAGKDGQPESKPE